MSFDLVVWHASTVPTVAEADRKYGQAMDAVPATVPADPRAVAFHRELTARCPSLASLPPEEWESSPWSGNPVVSGDAVIMTIGWSAAETVLGLARELAERHEFVLYDRQARAVYSPPSLRDGSMSVLSACDGSRVENPDAAQIEAVLGRLSPKNWFAVLERGDRYVQVGLGEHAATRSPWLALEHRESGPDRHFRVEVADRARIVHAFTCFAVGDDGWRQEFDWRRVEY